MHTVLFYFRIFPSMVFLFTINWIWSLLISSQGWLFSYTRHKRNLIMPAVFQASNSSDPFNFNGIFRTEELRSEMMIRFPYHPCTCMVYLPTFSGIFMLNVGKYTIDGCYGIVLPVTESLPQTLAFRVSTLDRCCLWQLLETTTWMWNRILTEMWGKNHLTPNL